MAIASGVVLTAPGYAGTHVVQRGDTLAAIAREYGVSLNLLVRANRGLSPDRILPGQEVEIPEVRTGVRGSRAGKPAVAERPSAAPASHVVRKGESLTAIARRCNTSVEALVKLNGLTDENRLQAGQTILIPGTGRASGVVRRERAEPAVDLTPPPVRREVRSARSSTAVDGIRYRVKRGETTSTIARKHGISWGELARANRGIDPNHLAPGQIIRVPSRERGEPEPAAYVRKAPPREGGREAGPALAERGGESPVAPRSASRPVRSSRQAAAPEPAPEAVEEDPVQDDFELPAEVAADATEMVPAESPDHQIRNGVKVSEGDTLETIAAEFGTTEDVLRQLNGLTAFDKDPVPGSFIIIPRQAMRAANLASHPS